jgi:hypothetical protein
VPASDASRRLAERGRRPRNGTPSCLADASAPPRPNGSLVSPQCGKCNQPYLDHAEHRHAGLAEQVDRRVASITKILRRGYDDCTCRPRFLDQRQLPRRQSGGKSTRMSSVSPQSPSISWVSAPGHRTAANAWPAGAVPPQWRSPEPLPEPACVYGVGLRPCEQVGWEGPYMSRRCRPSTHSRQSVARLVVSIDAPPLPDYCDKLRPGLTRRDRISNTGQGQAASLSASSAVARHRSNRTVGDDRHQST